jgi:hypothetical protein
MGYLLQKTRDATGWIGQQMDTVRSYELRFALCRYSPNWPGPYDCLGSHLPKPQTTNFTEEVIHAKFSDHSAVALQPQIGPLLDLKRPDSQAAF